MQVRRIVVGLELGKLSDAAIARAMQLGRSFDARVDVVHGIGIEPLHRGAAGASRWAEHVAESEARTRAACRGKLELLVEDPKYAETPVDEYLHVRPEPGAQALLEFAEHHRADVIVIGSHHHRRLFDFGGTSRAVLARSPCPVWVEPTTAERFERVVAPIDLSVSSELVLDAAQTLGERYDVPVTVLHVFVPPAFAYDPEGGVAAGPSYVVDGLRDDERASLGKLVEEHDWKGVRVTTELAEGEPSTKIVELAGANDLIVMGTHGRTGLSRAVLGSCAYRVLKHGTGPMLVVPQSAEHYLEPGSSE